MKRLKWWFASWDTWQKRYAGWNVCPDWGHKPPEMGKWDPEDALPGNAKAVEMVRCQNCGQLYERGKERA